MSLIELSPLFTRRQLKNQEDNNRRNLCLGAGGPEVRQGKGSTGTGGGDVASFPLATTFFIFSSTHLLIILIFLRHKIHPQTCTNQKSSHFLYLCKFQPIYFHMEVTLAQMVQGTLFKIPASGQNVPQCALLVCFTWWRKFLQNILKQKTVMF